MIDWKFYLVFHFCVLFHFKIRQSYIRLSLFLLLRKFHIFIYHDFFGFNDAQTLTSSS